MPNSIISKLIPNRSQRIHPEIYCASPPCVKVKDPCVKSKDPCVKVKDPCSKMKDPCSKVKDPCVKVKDPCVKIYAKFQESGAYEKYKMELSAS